MITVDLTSGILTIADDVKRFPADYRRKFALPLWGHLDERGTRHFDLDGDVWERNERTFRLEMNQAEVLMNFRVLSRRMVLNSAEILGPFMSAQVLEYHYPIANFLGIGRNLHWLYLHPWVLEGFLPGPLAPYNGEPLPCISLARSLHLNPVPHVPLVEETLDQFEHPSYRVILGDRKGVTSPVASELQRRQEEDLIRYLNTRGNIPPALGEALRRRYYVEVQTSLGEQKHAAISIEQFTEKDHARRRFEELRNEAILTQILRTKGTETVQ